MHFVKNFAAITALGAFLATSVASPAPAPAANASNALKAREELANEAIVNVYSGDTCGGSSSSYTVVGGSLCQAVSNARSIEVSEKYVYTFLFDHHLCLEIPASSVLELTVFFQ